jgi:hypothetical protein
MQLLSWLSARMTCRPQTRRALAQRPTKVFRPRVEVLEGRDLPSFVAPGVYPSLDGTLALVTADVNGDGKPDLITAADDGKAIAVHLNTGKGAFGAPIIYTGGGPNQPGNLAVTALAVGPYNGKPSIWAASWYPGFGAGPTMADVNILQLTSKGTLHSVGGVGWDSTGPISSLAPTDLDGDGATDLVAAPDGGVELYVARASSGAAGGFGPVQTIGIPGTLSPSLYGPAQVAVGDFNADGKPDVLVTETQWNAVTVLLNAGSGTFGAEQTSSVGADPAAVAVGDVSGDGKLDVVTTNTNGTVSVLLGQGNGMFAAAQNYALGGAANSVALGDFNKDGRLDIATTGNTEMDVLLNNSNGAFGTAQHVGPAGSDVIVADFNGDGFADLAQIDASGSAIDVLLNSGGTATQGSVNILLTSSSNPSTVGQPVTFTATVTATSAGTGSPTGTVTFMDGSTVLAKNVQLVNGVATCMTTTLGKGKHKITVVYSGDTDFLASTSSVLTETVH